MTDIHEELKEENNDKELNQFVHDSND